jgi:8-hydroxy-5-deazaflavin:NADPH oxidoreductase
MDIGIIGSGRVAQTLAVRMLELGHRVTVSSRDPSREKDPGASGALQSADGFAAAQRELGRDAAAGSFADAAAAGEVVINATVGGHSLDALEAAGESNLAGKILVDVANPLDFSGGMPPTLLFCNTESLAERIQAAFPDARVVKSLNTVNAQIMIDPTQLAEPTAMFVSGDDQEAKDWVQHELLERWFGWEQVLDLGGLTAARGQEMWMPLWLRLMGAAGTAAFNLRIVVAA